LRACRFVNPRRERFRGQEVLVFDFEPNPEFKPEKLEEKVVQKLAGVMWIDEKALNVARLQAYFVRRHENSRRAASQRAERHESRFRADVHQ